MHPTVQRVVEAAAARGLALDHLIREFPESTRTAEEAARAVGCGVGQIVKSLLFVVDGRPTMALVSGANRLDEARLAALCGVARKRVRRADADTARAATGYAIGGVPPFGHTTPLPVYVDRDLLAHETVWAAAGTPRAVFPVAPAELVRVSAGEVAELAAPPPWRG